MAFVTLGLENPSIVRARVADLNLDEADAPGWFLEFVGRIVTFFNRILSFFNRFRPF